MLKRKFYDVLMDWKRHHRQEGLLVKGARQIGKTFIIDLFGRRAYSSYIYLNFVTNPEYRTIFDGSIDATSIYRRISATFVDFKLIPGETLLFLDEIQNCPRARTAFKPLALDGKVDVIGSGSLLGLNFLDDSTELKRERAESSIPVGYERQVTMYPLDFEEYLWGVGYQPQVIDDLRESFEKTLKIDDSINNRFHELFREFIVTGGMPEVVTTFLRTNSHSAAFAAQQKILTANLDDIARYAPTTEKPKIRACYLSIPKQLARENKKFKYSEVSERGRSRMFGSSVDWLREAAIAYKCHNVENPEIPLSIYGKDDCFKLYSADVGILVAMAGFDLKKKILDQTLRDFAKGGIYENVIMTQLVSRGYNPFYHRSKSNQSEIDFLIEKDGAVIPIEVKSSNDSCASFDRMLERDDIQIGYKFTNGNIGRNGKKITLPHYVSMFL